MREKKLLKDLESCKHPNSRKTKAIAKKIKLQKNREKIKLGFAERANVLGKTLAFLAERITEGREDPLTPDEFEVIIEQYFHRFDDELEQIKLKTQIHKNRQNHASRESVIKITLEKDVKNFNAGGIELPNLCDPVDFKKFMEWDGNSHSIQHMKLTFISKGYLNKLRQNQTDTNSGQTSSQVTGASSNKADAIETMES